MNSTTMQTIMFEPSPGVVHTVHMDGVTFDTLSTIARSRYGDGVTLSFTNKDGVVIVQSDVDLTEILRQSSGPLLLQVVQSTGSSLMYAEPAQTPDAAAAPTKKDAKKEARAMKKTQRQEAKYARIMAQLESDGLSEKKRLKLEAKLSRLQTKWQDTTDVPEGKAPVENEDMDIGVEVPLADEVEVGDDEDVELGVEALLADDDVCDVTTAWAAKWDAKCAAVNAKFALKLSNPSLPVHKRAKLEAKRDAALARLERAREKRTAKMERGAWRGGGRRGFRGGRGRRGWGRGGRGGRHWGPTAAHGGLMCGPPEDPRAELPIEPPFEPPFPPPHFGRGPPPHHHGPPPHHHHHGPPPHHHHHHGPPPHHHHGHGPPPHHHGHGPPPHHHHGHGPPPHHHGHGPHGGHRGRGRGRGGWGRGRGGRGRGGHVVDKHALRAEKRAMRQQRRLGREALRACTLALNKLSPTQWPAGITRVVLDGRSMAALAPCLLTLTRSGEQTAVRHVLAGVAAAFTAAVPATVTHVTLLFTEGDLELTQCEGRLRVRTLTGGVEQLRTVLMGAASASAAATVPAVSPAVLAGGDGADDSSDEDSSSSSSSSSGDGFHTSSSSSDTEEDGVDTPPVPGSLLVVTANRRLGAELCVAGGVTWAAPRAWAKWTARATVGRRFMVAGMCLDTLDDFVRPFALTYLQQTMNEPGQ